MFPQIYGNPERFHYSPFVRGSHNGNPPPLTGGFPSKRASNTERWFHSLLHHGRINILFIAYPHSTTTTREFTTQHFIYADTDVMNAVFGVIKLFAHTHYMYIKPRPMHAVASEAYVINSLNGSGRLRINHTWVQKRPKTKHFSAPRKRLKPSFSMLHERGIKLSISILQTRIPIYTSIYYSLQIAIQIAENVSIRWRHHGAFTPFFRATDNPLRCHNGRQFVWCQSCARGMWHSLDHYRSHMLPGYTWINYEWRSKWCKSHKVDITIDIPCDAIPWQMQNVINA